MPKFYPLLLLFMLATTAANAESPYYMIEDHSVLPIQVIDKLVLVEAEVDGLRGLFLFDTGIGALALNERFFNDRANFQKFSKITDVNGHKAKLEGRLVEAFRWGGVQRDSFLAPVVDISHLEKVLDAKIMGLLGWEVFTDLEVYIDFDGLTMTLKRLDPVGNPLQPTLFSTPSHILAFEMEQHLPVIQASIGECPLRLGFDTGATINLINKKLRQALPENSRRLFRIPYGGVLSDSRAPFIAVEAIEVDQQFVVSGWRMAATPMNHFHRKEIAIDGLIGADLFRLGRVAINYKKREIAIWVNDNIFSQRYQALDEPLLVRKPASAQ